MKKPNYKLLDHTADFGIEVTSEDDKSLFEKTALAMFDLIVNTTVLVGMNKHDLHLQGSDRCDLMVNWLRELLYLFNGQKKLVKSVKVHAISQKKLSATVTYDAFDPSTHEIRTEIKAVTYHQIKVEQTSKNWIARIIFDV